MDLRTAILGDWNPVWVRFGWGSVRRIPGDNTREEVDT
jgi:hypothetical protein